VAARKQRIAVVGLGRFGTCLTRSLIAARLGPITIASARRSSLQRMAAELGDAVVPERKLGSVARADLVFLAVPDARIASVCAELPIGEGSAVVHSSGALDVLPLMAAANRGAQVGVFHPLQAFPPGANAARFRGIHIGIEADDALRVALSRLARRLGAIPFSLNGVDRAAYHAAAVLASNHIVALHAAASSAWERAGLPKAAARAALAPLSRGAIEAIAEHPLAEALTGPLARGDVPTIERHLAALKSDREMNELYRALSRRLLDLPLAIDRPTRARLARLLRRERS
jgi:predicted short-subunit dehydrogenase-like oxidoreductase (DUF2520 family)